MPPAAAVKPEESQKEEKPKSTRRGRRGGHGRGRAESSEAPKAEGAEPAESVSAQPAASEPASVQPAAAVKPEEVPKEEAAPAPAETVPASAASAAPAGPSEAKERPARGRRGRAAKEDKPQPLPVNNTAVPTEPAKVTVTVHDVPMVTHTVPEAKQERSQTASRAQALLQEKKVSFSQQTGNQSRTVHSFGSDAPSVLVTQSRRSSIFFISSYNVRFFNNITFTHPSYRIIIVSYFIPVTFSF